MEILLTIFILIIRTIFLGCNLKISFGTFNMEWKITFRDRKPRIGIMVSKYAHCFYDILSRYDSGEWKIDIPLIISNHKKFEHIAKRHKIPFYHMMLFWAHINHRVLIHENKTVVF